MRDQNREGNQQKNIKRQHQCTENINTIIPIGNSFLLLARRSWQKWPYSFQRDCVCE